MKRMPTGSKKIIVHDYAGHAFPIELSRELAKRGNKVWHIYAGDLVTPRGDLRKKDNDPDLLDFICIPIGEKYRDVKYSYFRRWSLERNYGKRVSQQIAQLHPDVVLSGNTPSGPQLDIAKQCSSMGIRMVSWVQDFYSLAVERILQKKLSLLGLLVGKYYKYMDRRVFSASDAIVSITPDFVPIIESFGGTKNNISTIPNWAPIEKLPLLNKSNSWSRSTGVDESFNIVYSGTLALKHNPELLIRLAMSLKGRPTVKIIVISEGPGIVYLREQLRTLKLTNLILMPFQRFEDFPKILASSDVLLGILEKDAGVFSVPSKILSYLCAAKPLVAAMPLENLAAKIVTDNQAGIVVEPNDERGFIDAIERLLENNELRVSYGSNGRRYAEENFQIDAVCDQFGSALFN